MQFENFAFGSIRIDRVTYDHDVIIDRGSIRKRKKKPSKKFPDDFGHTPLSIEESIPWECQHLVIGTGAYGRLPVMEDVKREARRSGIDLIIQPTTRAVKILEQDLAQTNAILHITC
jgi:hypothetical protein